MTVNQLVVLGLIVVWTLLLLHEFLSRRGDDTETWRYRTLINDPNMPARFHGDDLVPKEYRGVLEQSDDGSYRFRSFVDIRDSEDEYEAKTIEETEQ